MSEEAKIEGAERAVDGEYRTRGSNPVETDHQCAGCGYNLRGIDRAGICPECSMAVAESFVGDRLQDARYGALRWMHLGVVLVMVIYACDLYWGMLGVIRLLGIDTPGWMFPYNPLIGPMVSAVYAAGIWGYTSRAWRREDGQEHPRCVSRVRPILRVIAVVSLVSVVLHMLLWRLARGDGTENSQVQGILNAYMRSVRFVSTVVFVWRCLDLGLLLLYTRWLAWRVPSGKLAKLALRCAWGLPLMLVMSTVASLLLVQYRDTWLALDWLGSTVWLSLTGIVLLILNSVRRYLLAEIITRTDSRGKGGRPLLDVVRGGRWICRTVRAVPSRDMRIEEGNRGPDVS